MGIQRRLPQSDESRKTALIAAKTKNDATAVGNRHLTASTQTRLNDIVGEFTAAMLARGVALAAQSSKTEELNTVKELAQKFVSHYLQVFNLGVARGKYPASERSFFQLPVSSDALPKLTTEQDIIEWGLNIVAGDIARIAAGGTAMSNPTTAEVESVITAFTTLNNEQSALKDTYDNAQQDVANLRTEADAVTKKVWDETETHFNEEAPPSMRRKCRAWGVVYVSTTEITFNFTVTDSVSGSAIGNAVVTLTETGNIHNTDAAGKVTIVSTIADEANFTFEHPDYNMHEQTVEITDGQTVFNIAVTMVHV